MIEDEPREDEREWPVSLSRGAALSDLNRLVEGEHLPEATAAYVWDVLIQPLYDQRQLFSEWDRNRCCRRCQAMHFSHKDYERFPSRQKHRMHCPKYVGPLEHIMRTSDFMIDGMLRFTCSCGQSYPAYTYDDEGNQDEVNTCPDAAVDWRGPRPVE